MENTNQGFDFTNVRDLLAIVFKHKYKVLITFVVIFVIGILAALQTRPVYEARSVLLVKFGREYLQRPDGGAGGGGFAVPPETIMRGEIGILTSQDVVKKVIDDIGLYNIYPGLSGMNQSELSIQQVAINLFQRNLVIANTAGSNLVQINFTHSNPVMAAKVVNTLVDASKEKHLQVFGGNSTEFLESQQKSFEQRLKESEQRFASFKDRNRVYSLDEQRTALITQRSTLDTNLKAALSQMNEWEQKIAFVRSPKWVVDIPSEIRSQLTALQQRERETLQKYNDTSTIVKNIRQEMQVLKDTIKKYTEEQREIELGKADGELSIVKARVESIKRQIGQADFELNTLETRGREFQDLKREAAQQEQNYQTYAKKVEDSLILDDMDRRKMVAISVVEKAIPSILPKKQKLGRTQMIAVGLVGGIVGGIALAFLLEFLSPGMTTPMSAERRLGLPVMVAIATKE
jgi:polysaccharide biosynthesis protein PslE